MRDYGYESWLLLGVLSLLWGSAFLFQDIAIEHLPATTATAARLVIAALVLLVALRATGQRLPSAPRAWACFLLLGAIGSAAPFALTTWAQDSVESNIAGILLASVPIITLVLAHLFVEHERLSVRRAVGFLIGFAGIIVLLGPDDLLKARFGSRELLAYGALLGAAFCFAANAVIATRLPDMSALAAAAGVVLGSCLIVVPAAIWIDADEPMRLGGPAVLSVLALGLIITAGGTYAYFRLLARAGPTFLSLFNYLNPVVALACGVALLGESLQISSFVALALILLGVTVSELSRYVRFVRRLAGT